MKKEQFLKDVMHEIEMIKLHADQEEKNRLDFGSFNPEYATDCIYGQMTGSCRSARAKKLMELSCIRVMDIDNSNFTRGISIEDDDFQINGEYTGQTWGESYISGSEGTFRWGRDFRYLSALEGYIFSKEAKNEEIIKYLKGEIDTLEL